MLLVAFLGKRSGNASKVPFKGNGQHHNVCSSIGDSIISNLKKLPFVRFRMYHNLRNMAKIAKIFSLNHFIGKLIRLDLFWIYYFSSSDP